MTLSERAIELLGRAGSEPGLVVARAPGRVNLIGDHTDYNDGFVLPFAIPFGVVVAAVPNRTRSVRATSRAFGETTFDLDADPSTTRGWGRYLHGMVTVLRQAGIDPGGFDAAVVSDIPGSSLSSSAALEMACGTAIVAMAGASIEPTDLALLGQRVEHEFIGVPCGIMDQLISASAQASAATLIDCRSLDRQPIPLPEGGRIVVLDTGTRRGLVESAYAERRAACERVVATADVSTLRDVSVDELDALELHGDDRRRARHVVAENARVLEAAEAAAAGELAELGRLMNESHTSLRDDFEVSSPALDAAVDLARSLAGCLGARITGGGFAGAAIALVAIGRVDEFVATMAERFVAPPTQPSTETPGFHVVWPVQGAHVVQPEA